MIENNVYILFGTKKSINDYFVSVNHLIETTKAIDYIVDVFKSSELDNSKEYSLYLKEYQKFVFISKQDFDLIHHALLKKARTFMKNNT